MTEREELEALFQEKMPTINELDAINAQKIMGEHGQIVSVNGRRVALSHFMVTFVSDKGVKAGPLILNSLVARALCKLLLDDRRGPEDTRQT
jgi:hypothetical protein